MSKYEKTTNKLVERFFVPLDKQPYKLPENWGWIRLDELCSIKTGKLNANAADENGAFPFFTCSKDIYKINEFAFDGEAILLAGNGDFNVKYYSGKFNAYQRTYVLQNFMCYGKYLFLYLLCTLDILTRNNRGSTIKYIRLSDLQEHLVCLPPINEQKRIAEKVELLLDKIEEAKQLIEEAKETFELRRAAILNKAFSGELTGKWREENSIDQSVNELLEKIRIEKESTYLGLLDKANIEGTKKPTRPKKFQNEINHEYGKTLPNKWGYCTLGDVIYDFKYGTSEKSDYGFEGTPVIRIPNIGEEYINADDLKYLKENSINFNALVLEGDILIVRSNGSKDLVGKCSIVQKGEEKYAFASYLIRIRPVLVVPEFILWLLKSDRVREQFFSKSKSSAGINNINTEELATTIIPLPPIEEQREIVQKLKALLAKEDEIKKILDLDNYVKALKQSILSKAFRGELGTNAPSVENAIELLKEVLQERFK
ncbi:restriction endonuclease subunit S [Bacillus pumilus]|uniref:restriction endonuclease subunit S n=1 Tax=Bacillus pumilus TaxID=1408 RepID=UPI00345E95F0